MNIETRFNCGDRAWVLSEFGIRQLTIGQIRVIVTDTPGLPGKEMYSNYAPSHQKEEQYMCIETGIGSGKTYLLDSQIFATAAECAAANAEQLAEIESCERQNRMRKLENESRLRAELAEIETIKAEERAR